MPAHADDEALPPLPADDPVFYTVPQIAKALGRGWTVRRTRDWLHRAGAIEKRHGTLVTTAERLASEFPEAYRRLLESGDGNDDND
jgi:hypothetical protein